MNQVFIACLGTFAAISYDALAEMGEAYSIVAEHHNLSIFAELSPSLGCSSFSRAPDRSSFLSCSCFVSL